MTRCLDDDVSVMDPHHVLIWTPRKLKLLALVTVLPLMETGCVLPFADVEMRVVVMAPWGIVISDEQANHSGIISELNDGVKLCMATQSCVNKKYRRGLSTHPWGAPVLRVSEEEVVINSALSACVAVSTHAH